MKVYGLIGYPLTHSFSQKYFATKFEKEKIEDIDYGVFELPQIQDVLQLMANKQLEGFNVTIPYKQVIIPYLQNLDESALKVGAVNVVKREQDGTWKGYNSDFYGFKTSLKSWLPNSPMKALVLGTGGASKAVIAALEELEIPYQYISRSSKNDVITYNQLKISNFLTGHKLIINTTPLGTFPNVDTAPDIDYSLLTSAHYLYDLVYNPSETKFLTHGSAQGSQVKNGLEMLNLQAEKSWKIWSTNE